MSVFRIAVVALILSPTFTASTHAGPSETWGFVEIAAGPHLVLDSGLAVRLNANTPVKKADGSAGKISDVTRGSRAVISLTPAGTARAVQVFRPGPVQEICLDRLPPVRGAANGVTARWGGQAWPRSLATLRVSYPRPATYVRFETRVLYQPREGAGAPRTARFVVQDSFGDVLCEKVVPAGGCGPLAIGLDAQATDRLTLAVMGGEGQLRQDWCLWLDPRFFTAWTGGAPHSLSAATVEKLVAGLTKTPLEGLTAVAIAPFVPTQLPSNDPVADLQADLIVALAQHWPVLGPYAQQLDPGLALDAKRKPELQKLGASHVVTGSISLRPDGLAVNALLVQVDNGALLAAAAARGER
jgi:TolB-like protein